MVWHTTLFDFGPVVKGELFPYEVFGLGVVRKYMYLPKRRLTGVSGGWVRPQGVSKKYISECMHTIPRFYTYIPVM